MIVQHHQGALRLLIATVVTLTLSWFWGITHFDKDPGSIFFDPTRAFDRSYSLFRELEARTYLDEALHAASAQRLGTAHEAFSHSGPAPRMCATIVTAPRQSTQKTHPLELSLSSALAGLTQPERKDLDLRVYFATTKPERHPLWQTPLLNLTNKSVVAVDIASDQRLADLIDLEERGAFAHKTVLDFALALEDCLGTSNAPYIALFEGDVLFADGWFARSIVGLQDILENRSQTPWLDMRLFNEERSIGWASDKVFANNEIYIALGVGCALLVLVVLLRCCTKLPTPANTTLFVLVCLTIPLFIVFFFQAGKASMVPVTAGVSRQDWGCCTQGIIMPREQVGNLIKQLERRAGDAAADIIIEDYARDAQLARYALNPVQIQHLGFESILSPERPREQSVWSMAYEYLDPVRLSREHKSMVAELYDVKHVA